MKWCAGHSPHTTQIYRKRLEASHPPCILLSPTTTERGNTMITHYFYGAKGGVGTSTVAAAHALILAETSRVLFVDMSPARDGFAVFGIPAPINGQVVPVKTENLDYVNQWDPAGDNGSYDHVVIDLGTLAENCNETKPSDENNRTYLVARLCYLSLRAASSSTVDTLIVISEQGRALQFSDAEAVIDAGTYIEVKHDPAISRAVDAGLLSTRMPRPLHKALTSSDTPV